MSNVFNLFMSRLWLGLFHGTERSGTERNAGLKHGTHGTKHYKYHVTAHASHVFILVCVWSTPWVFRVSRSPFQTSEVLSLLLEPPADSISVYRPVKCTSTI